MTPITNQISITSNDIKGIYGSVKLQLNNGETYTLRGQSILKLIDGGEVSIRISGDLT